MLNEGDPVLLYSNGNFWITFLSSRGKIHTHLGVVNHKDIIGKKYGEYVLTHLGKKLWILKPSIEDYILSFIRRKTQIVYPKDSGYLLLKAGICSGSKVLEVGTGSGALTTVLANAVKPNGKVDTYERREDFYRLARENISKLGLDRYVNFNLMDFKDAKLPENYYDAAFIDIDAPWEIIDKIWYSLKGGCTAVFIIPTYTQLEKLTPKLMGKFIDIKGQEVSYREIILSPGRIRPQFQMIGYTAVLVTCRKIFS